jgi:hypothetical protein
MRTDFLYRFVHALDKGEVNACRSADHLTTGKWAPLRMVLFNTLLEMEHYDHERLIGKLGSKEFTRSITSEKYRMYRALLHTVTDLRARREDSNRAWASYLESNVLVSLGMPEEACAVTLSGIAEAERVHDLYAELQLREQLRVIYKTLPRKDNQPDVTENEYRLETVVLKVANLSRYTAICDRIDDYQSRFRMAEDVSVRAALEGLRSDPLLASMDMAISLPAQILFASAHAFIAHAEGDLPKAVEHMYLCLSLCESCPERIAHLPSQYRQALSNLMGMLNLMGQRDMLPVLLKKLEQVPVTDRRDAMLAFSDVELQYQLYFMNAGEPEQVVLREQTVLAGLRRFGRMVRESRQMALLFNLGVAHLLNDSPKEAKAYMNRIHDMSHSRSRLDLQGLARMLRLLLILENDQDDRFGHFLRNNHRTFRKGMPFYAMEDCVHSWLAKHHSAFHTHRRKEVLMDLHLKLLPFVEKRLPGAEEIDLWTIGRATGRPVSQIFKERMSNAR